MTTPDPHSAPTPSEPAPPPSDELARRRAHAQEQPVEARQARKRPRPPASAALTPDQPELVPTVSPSIAQHLSAWELSAIEALSQHSLAPSTRTTYANVLAQFNVYCAERNLTSLPASPSTVAGYLATVLIDPASDPTTDGPQPGRLRPGTATKTLAAINRAHRIAGEPAPGEHPLVQAVLWGARRVFGTRPVNAKTALTLTHLLQLLHAAAHDPIRERNRQLAHLWAAGHTPSELARQRHPDGAPRFPRRPTNDDDDAPSPPLTALGITRILRRGAEDAGVPIDPENGPDVAPPRTPQMTQAITHQLNQPSLRNLRDTAVLLTIWTTAIRRSTASHLDWGDLLPTAGESPQDIRIVFRRLKGDTAGEGHDGWLIADPTDPEICPVTAYWAYRKELSRQLTQDPATEPANPYLVSLGRDGKVKLASNGQPQRLKPDTILRIIKQLAKRAGLAEEDCAPHGLRAGWITEALNTPGVTVAQVRAVSGHASLGNLSRYSRSKETQRDNPNRLIKRRTGSPGAAEGQNT